MPGARTADKCDLLCGTKVASGEQVSGRKSNRLDSLMAEVIRARGAGGSLRPIRISARSSVRRRGIGCGQWMAWLFELLPGSFVVPALPRQSRGGKGLYVVSPCRDLVRR